MISCMGMDARAQWGKAARSLSKKSSRSLATQHYLNRKLAEHNIQAARLQRAVFQLAPLLPQETILPNLKATGFVLEEVYHGKKYIWGVTATHYDFDLVNVESNGKTVQFAPFTAQGSKHLNDVSIFPLSPKTAKQFIPLHLADAAPKEGETLVSGGYFYDGSFHYEPNRKVQAIYPHRMITSLYVESGPYREGACGSPILNEQGEVVGMHIGSSETNQIGYAVTLEDIQAILNAQHQQNMPTETLVFNGREIGQLHINEGISSIEVFKDRQLLNRIPLYHDEKRVDYEHLEKLIDSSEADFVVIHIEKNQFSVYETGPVYRRYAIVYNLKSGYITYKEP